MIILCHNLSLRRGSPGNPPPRGVFRLLRKIEHNEVLHFVVQIVSSSAVRSELSIAVSIRSRSFFFAEIYQI